MNDKRIKVETADGKTYIVPVRMFSSLEEYKELDIKPGCDISLKASEVTVKHIEVDDKDITVPEGQMKIIKMKTENREDIIKFGSFKFQGGLGQILWIWRSLVKKVPWYLWQLK